MRWLNLLSLVCFGVLSLVLIYLNQKPLCIDSKLVERVDIFWGEKVERVYRCQLQKKVPYSPEFVKIGNVLESKLVSLERFFSLIGELDKKPVLHIQHDKGLQFKIQSGHIFLGKDLILAEGHLEKAFLRYWVQEKSELIFSHTELFEEVLSDLMLYALKNKLEVHDPQSMAVTELGSARWPFILKSLQAYCHSPWKRGEHYSSCNQVSARTDLENSVAEMSLRPFLSDVWVKAYDSLSLKDKRQFLRSLSFILAQKDMTLPKQKDLKAPTTLSLAVDAIKNVNTSFYSPTLKDKREFKRFLYSLESSLYQHGFDKKYAIAHFNFLFEIPHNLNPDSEELKQLSLLATENPMLQIAIKDPKNIWLLPSSFPIAVKSFGELRASRVVTQKCSGTSFADIFSYSEVAEKLFIVENCGDNLLDWQSYIHDGAQGFAQKYKNVSFVQLHLPSLLMKREELPSQKLIRDYLAFSEAPKKSFGWIDHGWQENVDAFKPKGAIDGVEWFRITEGPSVEL